MPPRMTPLSSSAAVLLSTTSKFTANSPMRESGSGVKSLTIVTIASGFSILKTLSFGFSGWFRIDSCVVRIRFPFWLIAT